MGRMRMSRSKRVGRPFHRSSRNDAVENRPGVEAEAGVGPMASRLFVVLGDSLHDAHASLPVGQRYRLTDVLRDESFNLLPPPSISGNQHALETKRALC